MRRSILLGDLYLSLQQDYPTERALEHFYSTKQSDTKKQFNPTSQRNTLKDRERELIFCWLRDSGISVDNNTDMDLFAPDSFALHFPTILQSVQVDEQQLRTYLEREGYPLPSRIFTEPDHETIKRKAIEGSLPDILTVREIALLWSYGSDASYSDIVERVTNAALTDIYADIEDTPKLIERFGKTIESGGELDPERIDPDLLRIHRSSFQRWLERQSLWPPDDKSLLSKWWHDSDKSKAHPSEAQGDVRTKRALLPSLSTKPDTWALVIAAMAETFYKATERLPKNHEEAWLAIKNDPSSDFGVSVGQYSGEPTLLIEGERPLRKSAFARRWKRYTQPRK